MEFVNISLPWMPERHAMIPQIVEKQLKTEQVHFYVCYICIAVILDNWVDLAIVFYIQIYRIKTFHIILCLTSKGGSIAP